MSGNEVVGARNEDPRVLDSGALDCITWKLEIAELVEMDRSGSSLRLSSSTYLTNKGISCVYFVSV